MASRKDLKKDIDYFVFDLISDCYACIDENPDQDLSGYEQIINDIIDLQEDLFSRINKYKPTLEVEPNEYFKAVKADLAEGLKKGYEALEQIKK